MTTQLSVATANILYKLVPTDAREALRGVLAEEPDLVGLQEWQPSRHRLLRETGRLGPVPEVGRRLRRLGKRAGPDYLWNSPAVGGCAVGARADRFEMLQCRPRLLSWVGRSDRPDRWMRIEPPRLATVAVYRDRQSLREVCLVSYHLAPGVQGAGQYRADRPILASRHQREVRGLERLIREQTALNRLVFAVGDSNFHGMRLTGLISAWDGRDDEPGTHGSRKIDDVHGRSAAESVTLLSSKSDHKAVLVRRAL